VSAEGWAGMRGVEELLWGRVMVLCMFCDCGLRSGAWRE
jgi:hypothetical protein